LENLGDNFCTSVTRKQMDDNFAFYHVCRDIFCIATPTSYT